MDNHEIVITGAGADRKAHFFTFTIQEKDLSAIGGQASVNLAGHQLVRMNAAGAVEFHWDAWEHIDPAEWVGDADWKAQGEIDFDHPNSLTFDEDSNYVVSWRSLDQVMVIDSKTGAIKHRIGGVKSDYEFVDDPFGGFSKQHAARIQPNGNLLLYDNGTGHLPQETRAVEYRIDATAKTATRVWQFRATPPIFTPIVGWTERLKSGNTWVAFSLHGRVFEVDKTGKVVWEAVLLRQGIPSFQYRIVPLSSLY